MSPEIINKNDFSFVFVKVDAGENFAEEIKSITDNRKVMFFSANEFGKQRNLNRLYKEMILSFEHEDAGKVKQSLENIFEYMEEKSGKERIVWVFDNVEEIFDEKDFVKIESMLKILKSTQSTVIFASKSGAFANKFEESKLVKYLSGPKIPSKGGFFSLAEENLTAEDKFKYYAIFGDKNEYRKKIDFSKDLKRNVVDNFFNTQGFFYSEPNRVLKKELRETQVYNMILEAIAKGNSTLNEISEFVEMPTGICNKYTTVLLSLGIITKIKPSFGQDTRKSRYKIKSNAMDFWYYFVPDNMSDIDFNNGDKVFDKNVEGGIHQYLQIKFPELCQEYISKLKKEDKIKIDIKENGVWWNKNDVIDIVAGSGLEAIVADCYWRDYEVGLEELGKLEAKAKNLAVLDREYYLFAKEGFSAELLELAKNRSDIKLFSFHDMVKGQEMIEKPKKKGFFFSRR